jgi:energy-coupling factor transporter ATP-binding protein EcfA2
VIVTTRQFPDGIEVAEYDRQEFLDDVWTYKPGEHLSLIGPTEAGKTTLGYELLGATATPALQGVVLVMKPQDETAAKFTKSNGFQKITRWPPPADLGPWRKRKPSGYTLWPKTDFHPELGIYRTRMAQYKEFNRCFAEVYRRGNRILFADELAALCDELGMREQVINMYSRGRSQRAGIWGATQRPVEIPRLAYSSAHHLFLAHDPDEQDRKRFGEIGGGIDPKIVDAVTMSLPQYWWLYLRRKDRTLCIVRA